ncbi:MAG TPA: S9 family peptidase, partial [Flavobacteriaceae bacterium]|nr:S9 family peptidase [Flavobacteriaceae bacterium]
MDVLHSMNNGKQYSVLDYNRTTNASSIDVYEYKTGEKVKTLVTSTNLPEVDYFISYEFSEDESKVLLATNLKQVYRHSSLGTYYVYDSKTKKATLLSENQVQEPTFSPDGSKIAYGYNSNLYVKDLASGITTQITSD